jgi:transcriptional regulator of acetoin/glycerol metabolism
VRELRFAVERAGLLAEHEVIGREDLPPEIVERSPRVAASSARDPAGADEAPDAARVRAALERARWRRADAARSLGVSPRTLHRWMKRLGL